MFAAVAGQFAHGSDHRDLVASNGCRAAEPRVRAVDLQRCLCFALDSDEQARSGFRYGLPVYQAEYSRNLLFTSSAQMEDVFNRVIDRTRSAWTFRPCGPSSVSSNARTTTMRAGHPTSAS